MTTMNYAQSKQDAIQMKQELLKQREQIMQEKERLDRLNGEIERQLIGLEQVLEGLEFLDSNIPLDLETPGFTEQIRRMLQETSVPLTAVQIRDSLIAAGVSQSPPKNLLISVHTVLGRLESNLKKTERDGKTAYIWKDRGYRRRHVFPTAKMRAAFGHTTSSDPGVLPPPSLSSESDVYKSGMRGNEYPPALPPRHKKE